MARAAEASRQKGPSVDRRGEAIAALGELLAAVSDVLEGIAIVRRRGPTRARRYASAIIALALSALITYVRSRARAGRQRHAVLLSTFSHHLRHPPHRWAAP